MAVSSDKPGLTALDSEGEGYSHYHRCVYQQKVNDLNDNSELSKLSYGVPFVKICDIN